MEFLDISYKLDKRELMSDMLSKFSDLDESKDKEALEIFKIGVFGED